MNILFFTGHPAQVHNFRILKQELEYKGHRIFWIATPKDISKYLLDHYNIKYTLIKKSKKTLISRISTLISNTCTCYKLIKGNMIDIIVSRVSPYASLAGFISRTAHIALADTESSGMYNKIFGWFVSSIITSDTYTGNFYRRHIQFNGNIELFYLHPNRYSPIERKHVTTLLGIEPDDEYTIMRFVSWDAYHDKGLSGMNEANMAKAVKEFSQYSHVFISSEKELPVELEPYKIKIPPEEIHHILYYATMFFGESGTMASESAVLGTPAIYLNDNWLGYLLDEQKYSLVKCFKTNETEQKKAIENGILVLTSIKLRNEFLRNHEVFLRKKIDVTSFFTWFIENWPDSYRIMKKDPDYQYRFH